MKNLRRKKKFEKCVKDKNNYFIKLLSRTFLFFFKQKYISFLEMYFFKIAMNLVASTFFFAEADTKQYRYASAKASAFADCQN